MTQREIIENIPTEEEKIEYLSTLSEREISILYLYPGTTRKTKETIQKYLSKQNKNLLNQLSE